MPVQESLNRPVLDRGRGIYRKVKFLPDPLSKRRVAMGVELVFKDEREPAGPTNRFDVGPGCHPNDEERAKP